MINTNWMGATPTDTRASPGRLWESSIVHGLIGRYSGRFDICRLPARERNSTARNISGRTWLLSKLQNNVSCGAGSLAGRRGLDKSDDFFHDARHAQRGVDGGVYFM